MHFTRDPIVETIITPKDGHKLVLRNSKGVGNEEYFVDAVEVVSFGNNFFFRSLERPKSFLLSVTDYEVLEVRETRMVLKSMSSEKTIKIAGGRESSKSKEKTDSSSSEEKSTDAPEPKEKRRRRTRRRRTKDKDVESTSEEASTDEASATEASEGKEEEATEEKKDTKKEEKKPRRRQTKPAPSTSSLLSPPPTLISETIGKYKDEPFMDTSVLNKEEASASEDMEASSQGEEEATPAVEAPVAEAPIAEAPVDDTEKEEPSPPPPPPLPVDAEGEDTAASTEELPNGNQ